MSSRRAFLKNTAGLGAGLMFSELLQIYLGAEQTLFKQAYAASPTSRRFINFHLQGAPPRWLFDQWLTPYANDPVLSSSNAALWNPGFATAFASNEFVYRTTTYRGVRVPHHYDVPVTLSSGSVPLSNLLDNMAVIRGFNSLSDGHEVNAPLQLYPDPAYPSLNGLAADQRRDRIASVVTSLTSTHPFVSGIGKSPTLVTDHYQTAKGGSLFGLMKAFQKTAAGSQGLTNLDSISDVMSMFEDAAKASIKANNARGTAMVDHLRATKDLSMMAVQSLLATQWSTLWAKYNGTVQANAKILNFTIPGVTDQAITTPASEFKNFNTRGDLEANWDLRQMLNRSDLVACQNMVRSFVIAEYCLKNDICGSLALGGGDFLGNVKFRLAGASTDQSTSIGTDQHDVPGRAAVLLSTSYYRGLSAGLLELVNALKATPSASGATLFDDTVIQISGDFARSPKYSPTQTATYNLSGSDHGWQSQVTTLISGLIDKPMIVGNISANHGYTNYRGLWGVGSAVNFNGSKEILSPRHVAAVISNMLGGQNPWSSTHLPFRVVNGKLERMVETEVTT